MCLIIKKGTKPEILKKELIAYKLIEIRDFEIDKVYKAPYIQHYEYSKKEKIDKKRIKPELNSIGDTYIDYGLHLLVKPEIDLSPFYRGVLVLAEVKVPVGAIVYRGMFEENTPSIVTDKFEFVKPIEFRLGENLFRLGENLFSYKKSNIQKIKNKIKEECIKIFNKQLK